MPPTQSNTYNEAQYTTNTSPPLSSVTSGKLWTGLSFHITWHTVTEQSTEHKSVFFCLTMWKILKKTATVTCSNWQSAYLQKHLLYHSWGCLCSKLEGLFHFFSMLLSKTYCICRWAFSTSMETDCFFFFFLITEDHLYWPYCSWTFQTSIVRGQNTYIYIGIFLTNFSNIWTWT